MQWYVNVPIDCHFSGFPIEPKELLRAIERDNVPYVKMVLRVDTMPQSYCWNASSIVVHLQDKAVNNRKVGYMVVYNVTIRSV